MVLGEGLILPGMGKHSTEEMLLSQVYEAEPTRWSHGVRLHRGHRLCVVRGKSVVKGRLVSDRRCSGKQVGAPPVRP